MVNGGASGNKLACFAPTPWTRQSRHWRLLDEELSDDHLVRQVDQAFEWLDLGRLLDMYLGVGKKPLRPDLLLKMVMYEMRRGRPSPAEWARDVRDSESVRWLLFGMEPSRARLYDFRDRIAPLWLDWNRQFLRAAVNQNLTPATRVCLDSTSVAAHATRRQLLNQQRLEKRLETIDAALRSLREGVPMTNRPGWLAQSEEGLRVQKRRYLHAAEVMTVRQADNARRRVSKRKPADNIVVSPVDPEALPSRDKLNVFRPLYNVQLLRDLDSPMLLAYDVLNQNNDNGVLEPMVRQMERNVGHKPEKVLVDSGYVSLRHLEFCEDAGICLYGPCQENDYSKRNGKKTQSNQHTQLPKGEFRWLANEQTYLCPEGHRLGFTSRNVQKRADYTVTLIRYTCPPEHCLACPRQQECTPTPRKGRSVSRMENEELLDQLRERMKTKDAKEFYKLRSQTVELDYADMKEHRDFRRFHGRGPLRTRAEAAGQVVVHNMLVLHAETRAQSLEEPDNATLTHVPQAA